MKCSDLVSEFWDLLSLQQLRPLPPVLPLAHMQWVWRALPLPLPNRSRCRGAFMALGSEEWLLKANLVCSLLVPPDGNKALRPQAPCRKAAHGSTLSCRIPLTLLILFPLLHGHARCPLQPFVLEREVVLQARNSILFTQALKHASLSCEGEGSSWLRRREGGSW